MPIMQAWEEKRQTKISTFLQQLCTCIITQKLSGKIDELNNSYKSHADLVDEVGDRYAELSQRVNKNTNANIDLSADDYAEFLDINKRLAVCLISYDKESVKL